jgi:Tfp pilus assembly protein PilX
LRDTRRDINGIAMNGAAARAMHVSHFGDGSGLDNGTCNSAEQRNGLCRPRPYTAAIDSVLPRFPDVRFTGLPSVAYGTYTGAPQLSGLAQQPHYVVEIFCLQQHGTSIGGTSWCKFYRITARGYGRNPNSQVTLQEVFLAI